MSPRQVCKSADHLFTPILEVTIPLLRCVRCNVYAYHDTVKQLAKNRSYLADREDPGPAVPLPLPLPLPLPYWRKVWLGLRHTFRFAI